MKNSNCLFLFFLFIGLTVNAQWLQTASDIYGEAADDLSGYSVSLSSDGSVVAIGAEGNDANGSFTGHVRVYQNISKTWQQIGSDIDGEAVADNSGYSVSLSSDGSIVAIGAPFNDGNSEDAGYVRVFQNNSGTWQQIGSDIDGEAANDYSGWSVSLSSDGSVVAIGAKGNDGSGDGAGHVRVYQNNSGTWQQIGSDIDGEAAGDKSGHSVNLSSNGSIVAIGAYTNDGSGPSAGHVRVFKNNSGTWQQIGSDIDGEDRFDTSGWSVSLSSNGSVVAVGAPWNDENGSNAGHVRVFKNNSGTWQQRGSDIDGEAIGNHFGYSVSLSSDGGVVAIGAPYYGGGGSDSGTVTVLRDVSLSIFEIINHQDISLYPNPTNNSFFVKTKKLKIEEITISDITGKEILSYNKSKIVNNGFETDISNLESAVYIISLRTDKGVITTKIIKR